MASESLLSLDEIISAVLNLIIFSFKSGISVGSPPETTTASISPFLLSKYSKMSSNGITVSASKTVVPL